MKILYSDGFNIGGNPSKIGGGYTITDELGEVVAQSQILKVGFTNNEGELLGVLGALELIDNFGEVYTDSTNTIAWVKKGKAKARPDLNQECAKAKYLIEKKKIKLIWINREENLAGIENEKGVIYHL
jgi:ribonuclease HI